jgi:hypothetical protein
MADPVIFGNGSIGSGHQPHHGWQQVTDKKAKRRQEAKEKKAVPNPVNGLDKAVDSKQGVFAALDALEGRRAATRYEEDEVDDRGRQTDDSDEDQLEGQKEAANGNGTEEKRPKPKKEKKPRVSVADAAAKIDPDGLVQFLEGVSVSGSSLGCFDMLDYDVDTFYSSGWTNFQLRQNHMGQTILWRWMP